MLNISLKICKIHEKVLKMNLNVEKLPSKSWKYVLKMLKIIIVKNCLRFLKKTTISIFKYI